MSDWIVSDPTVLGGKPRIRDTRISVEMILELLTSGASSDDIRRAYPHVPSEGFAAAVRYAAESLKNAEGLLIKVREALEEQ